MTLRYNDAWVDIQKKYPYSLNDYFKVTMDFQFLFKMFI